MVSLFPRDNVPGLFPVSVLVLVPVLIPDSWLPEKEQHYLIYYINCSVLQGFLPPGNVVSEHT